MEWRANSPVGHPPYQVPCMIRTRYGEEIVAELIKLNPKYHSKVKDKEIWHVAKHVYIKDDDVVEWKLL